ncbi:hypothetical protein ACJX0J_014488, partial [Zea mays]
MQYNKHIKIFWLGAGGAWGQGTKRWWMGAMHAEITTCKYKHNGHYRKDNMYILHSDVHHILLLANLLETLEIQYKAQGPHYASIIVTAVDSNRVINECVPCLYVLIYPDFDIGKERDVILEV